MAAKKKFEENMVVKLMKGPDGTPVESNFLSEE